MVEDEVHHQVDLEIMKIVDIFGIGQGFGDLVVDQRESAVKIGIEYAWQNVEGAEYIFEFFFFEKGYDIRKSSADAVGIGIQQGSQTHFLFCHISPF